MTNITNASTALFAELDHLTAQANMIISALHALGVDPADRAAPAAPKKKETAVKAPEKKMTKAKPKATVAKVKPVKNELPATSTEWWADLLKGPEAPITRKEWMALAIKKIGFEPSKPQETKLAARLSWFITQQQIPTGMLGHSGEPRSRIFWKK